MTLDQVDMDIKRGARIAQSTESDDSVTTSDKFTEIADVSWVEEGTLLLKNTTDVSVDFTIQVAPTKAFNEPFDLSPTETLTDGSSTAQRAVTAFSDPHRWLRVKYAAQSSPGSGQIDIWLILQGGA